MSDLGVEAPRWPERFARRGALVLAAVAGLLASTAGAAPPTPVPIALASDAELASVAASLGRLGWVRTVGSGEPAALALAPDGSGALHARDDAGRLWATLAGTDASAAAAAAHRAWLVHLASAPGAEPVTLRLERADAAPDDPPLRTVAPGEEIRWIATNRSQRPLWFTVLAVSPGGVSVVHPFRGRPRPVSPGERVEQKGEISLPEGRRRGVDALVLLATEAPLDPEPFLAPAGVPAAGRGLAATGWGAASQAWRVRRELVPEAERVRSPAASEPAIAREAPRADVVRVAEASPSPDVSLVPEVSPAPEASLEPAPRRAAGAAAARASRPVVVRPRPRVTRFVVHFAGDPELGAVRGRLRKLAPLCGRTGSACRIQRRSPAGAGFELARTGRRLRESNALTLSGAFEQAYQIRRGLEAARVEPLLELDLPAVEDHADAAGHAHARAVWQALRERREHPPAGGPLAGFRSLHPAGADDARVTGHYRALFGLGADAPLARVAYLDAELLHHYVLDVQVTAAVDAWLRDGRGGVDAAREALLRRALSDPLRAALRTAAGSS